MSVSMVTETNQRRSSFQPFQCTVCQSRFTRLENLKRHAAVHSRSQNEVCHTCDLCQATFSRPDLRLRHLKRKHPDHDEQRSSKRNAPQMREDEVNSNVGTSTTGSPSESRNDSPHQRSDEDEEVVAYVDAVPSSHQHRQKHNLPSRSSRNEFQPSHILINQQSSPYDPSTANYDPEASHDLEPSSLLLASFLEPQHTLADHQTQPQSTFIKTPLAFSFDQWSPDRPVSLDLAYPRLDCFPSPDQVTHGCDIFFTKCSAWLPVLHPATFNTTQAPEYLVLSMLCLAYQHGEVPSSSNSEMKTGASLAAACFQQARALITVEEETVAEGHIDAIHLVQAYLFLQVYAMMYSDADDSAYGLKTHSKMIALARASGLMQSAAIESAATEDLESLWRQFVLGETQKRTAFAMHQIDTLWYQFLSIPRLLSHLEVKHELPCSQDLWMASTAGEWAHKQLVSKTSTPSIQYSDAIRRTLSASDHLHEIQALDPYGAINIIQFLTSSAREISGWSTMTGMLSMERLAPIRASLLALGTIGRPKPSAETNTHMPLFEATWEAAMIEMQMWSPTHTGGIVARSLDAALYQLTHFAPSCEFLCEANVAGAVQSHLDWFLPYLESDAGLDAEAPWIVLYAWKAFMIAWQLVKGGIPGAMQAVGVEECDAQGALKWARKAFGRREKWKLGRTIAACLDVLQEQG